MSWTIKRPDLKTLPEIQARIASLIKPPGALGQLEELAAQMALVQQSPSLSITRPTLLLFAGDHGIAEEGVSLVGPEVSTLMVRAFLNGQAAVNCFARSVDMRMEVIDSGLLAPVHPRPEGLIERRAGAGTANLAHEAAMSAQQVDDCLGWGSERAQHHVRQGANLLAVGEMGIGNTSAASALMAALLQLPPKDCVGHGSGISEERLALKQALLEKAMLRAGSEDPLDLLAEFGGFEIVQMTGAILGAAEAGVLVVIDGFIATVAAIFAERLHPEARYYMVFAHQSAEQGHALLLQHMEARPLLTLDMRLGEGSGAVLALPLLRAAAAFYNDMASFSDLGIEL